MRNNRENTEKIIIQESTFTKKYKTCPFSNKNSPKIDYKNVKLLEKYISEKGKIMPSRISLFLLLNKDYYLKQSRKLEH